jgi:hypothetical protein
MFDRGLTAAAISRHHSYATSLDVPTVGVEMVLCGSGVWPQDRSVFLWRSRPTPWFHVAMVKTRPEDAYETFRALIDLANRRGAEQLSVWIPSLDWLIQAA